MKKTILFLTVLFLSCGMAFASSYQTSNISGNAATATALSANGTNCAGGEAASGVDASGNSEGCTSYLTSLSGSLLSTGATIGATAQSQAFTNGITAPSIVTASGALGITPASGSNLNVSLGTTGDFAVNTNQLYVDTSAARVGINTSTPIAALDVLGVANIGNTSNESGGIFINSVSTPTALFVSSQSTAYPATVTLHTHSTTIPPRILGARANTNTAGHVSVTAGQRLLELVGTGVTNNNNVSYNKFGSAAFLVNSTGTVSNTSAPGDFAIYTTPDGSITPTEKVRVLANGNTGVGTATPATALDVNGVITATGGNSTTWNTALTPNAVTASGTTCTITAITGGQITAASCV